MSAPTWRQGSKVWRHIYRSETGGAESEVAVVVGTPEEASIIAAAPELLEVVRAFMSIGIWPNTPDGAEWSRRAFLAFEKATAEWEPTP